MTELTEAEKADLHARLASWFGDDRQAFLVGDIARAVERIIDARLAPIRALAAHPSGACAGDTSCGYCYVSIDRLRAALSADLTAPQPTSGTEGQDEGDRAGEARCRTCGAPESNHPYRHPFKVWQPGRREATP